MLVWRYFDNGADELNDTLSYRHRGPSESGVVGTAQQEVRRTAWFVELNTLYIESTKNGSSEYVCMYVSVDVLTQTTWFFCPGQNGELTRRDEK